MDASRNEITIAIFLGIFVGLISMAAFYFISKKTQLFKSSPEKISIENVDKTKAQKNDTGKKTDANQKLFLNVTPLEKEIISPMKTFKIEGSTKKGSNVVVLNGKNSELLPLGRTGNFSASIALKTGINEVFITASFGDESITNEKIIYYQE